MRNALCELFQAALSFQQSLLKLAKQSSVASRVRYSPVPFPRGTSARAVSASSSNEVRPVSA